MAEANLSFKIDADSSPARRELTLIRSAVQKEVQTITESFAGAVPGVGGFAAALGPVGIGLGVVAGGALAAVGAVTSLVKSAVDAGSKFNDLSIKTGLSVETLSGLTLQAKQSGTSIEALATGVFMLQKNMAGASKDTLKFAADMGITEENVSDADGTLRRLLQGLAKIPDEATRNAVGAKLMGRGYADLAVLVKDLNGDVDGAIEATRAMGGLMSGPAAAAADRLGDELDALSARGQGLAVLIGSSIVPEITRAIEDIGAALNFNKGTWKEWADYIAEEAAHVRATIDGTVAEMRALFSIEGWSSPGAVGRIGAAAADASYAESDRRRAEANSSFSLAEIRAANARLRVQEAGSGRSGGGTGGGGGAGKARGGGGARNEAQQLELRELALFNKELQAVTQANREILEREYELNLKGLEEYFKKANEDNEKHYENQQRALNQEEEIARKYIKSKKELDIKLREIKLDRDNAEDERNKEQRRLEDLRDREQAEAKLALNKQLADTQESIRAGQLARAEAQAEAGIISQTQLEMRRRDLAHETFEDQRILLELELTQFGTTGARKIEIGNALIKLDEDRANAAEDASRRIITAIQAEQDARLPDPSGLEELRAKIRRGPVVEDDPNNPDPVPDFSQHISIIGTFKDFATSAFSSITQGFGGMIQAFLGGGAATSKGIGSMVKAIAAGLAAQALVEAAMQGAHAIKETALASASLAVFDVRGAALHSAAAAAHIAAATAFGLVGGVAAGIALAIPGGGGGGAGSLASQGSGNSVGGDGINRDRSNDPRLTDPARETGRRREQVVNFNIQVTNMKDEVMGHLTHALRFDGDVRDEVRGAALA
jgi:hypothetical protein